MLFVQLVQMYYERSLRSQEGEWLLLPQLDAILKGLEPSFVPRHYGFNILSELVRETPLLFATRRRSAKGRPIEVSLLWDGNVTKVSQAEATV